MLKKSNCTVVFSLLLALVMLFPWSLTSCSLSSDSPSNSYASYLDDGVKENSFVKEYYEKVTFKFDPPKTGDSGSTSVVVSLPDLEKIYENYTAEFSEAKTSDNVQKIIKKHVDEFTIEKELTAEVYKDGDDWRLKSTENIDELVNTTVDEFLAKVISNVEFETHEINLHEIIDQVTAWEESGK